MKLSVDPFTDTAGWVLIAPSTVAVNGFSEFIAGLNTQSLMFTFDATDTTRTATKTYAPALDVSAYDELVFSFWSWRYKGFSFKYPEDFHYTITINGTREYRVPTWDSFSDVTIWIGDINTISEIKFTAVDSGVTDYIIVSEMLAVSDELPRDLFQAIQETIEFHITDIFGLGKTLGLMTGTAQDGFISIDGLEPWLERYSVVVIDDGVNRETHQVEDNDGDTFFLNSMYDGPVLLNDFTDADVYLKFITTFGQWQKEIVLPGIVIWNMVPEPILRGGKLEQIIDTYDVTNSTYMGRSDGQINRWDILIDCEARHYELIADMGKVVRRFIQQENLWINGRRHDIYYEGSPIEITPTEFINMIPKVQYTVGVEIKEETFERVSLPNTDTINFTPVPVEQGELP